MPENDSQKIAKVRFALSKHFPAKNMNAVIEEFKGSSKSPEDFIRHKLLTINKSDLEIKNLLSNLDKNFIKHKLKKKTLLFSLIIFIAAFLFLSYGHLKNTFAIKQTLVVDSVQRIYLTTGFYSRESPTTNSKRSVFFQYGDTVTTIRESGNWVMTVKNNVECYVHKNFVLHSRKFAEIDSLFPSYHYHKKYETINSKVSLEVLNFINKLHGGLKEWYIPVEEYTKRQKVNAVLSLPRKQYGITVIGEGLVEQYHMVLVTRRSNALKKEINSYLLLFQIKENGVVSFENSVPIRTNDLTGRIVIEDFNRFEVGDIDNNIYFNISSGSSLLVLKMLNSQPRWEWIDWKQ